MNIKIKSTQIYDDHEETIEEQCENAIVNFLDKNVIINYNKNEIVFDIESNIVNVKRDANDIQIELDKENELMYETPYGKFVLKTFGEFFCMEKVPFKITIEYKITLNDTISYKNIIDIRAVQ